MSTKATLIKAREYIAKGWTQGVLARDADGRPVYQSELLGGKAVCWCMEGGLMAALGTVSSFYEGQNLWAPLINAAGKESSKDVVGWQDTPGRTQAEVLDLFDRALAIAED